MMSPSDETGSLVLCGGFLMLKLFSLKTMTQGRTYSGKEQRVNNNYFNHLYNSGAFICLLLEANKFNILIFLYFRWKKIWKIT